MPDPTNNDLTPPVQAPAGNPPPGPQRIPPTPPPAGPQRVPAAPKPVRVRGRGRGRGRKVWAALAAGVVLVAIVTGVGVYLNHRAANTPEAKIRASIGTFVQAVEQGDLPTLRSSTCGSLAEFYRTVPESEFADVHQLAIEQQSIPVVTSIDAVQITEGAAIAQVTAHTPANPAEQSPRTFNLLLEGDSWKICDPE